MTRINTNVSSLVAQNTLGRSNASLNQALTRLSTGLRINTGKDDPAGLIASENLRSDITSIRRAITNTDRANQVIATADSALGQVSSLLNDIRGLVTESANSGALSDDQIAANQLQIDSSLEALNRIAQTTTFQGRRLLDGSLDFITAAGANFTQLNNLKIDQANLGATGSVNIDVTVSSAATRATVEVANIPEVIPAVASEGTLTFADTAVASAGEVSFSVETTPAAAGIGTVNLTIETADSVQATTLLTFNDNNTLEISAVQNSAIDGTAGNGVSIVFDASGDTGGAVSVDYNAGTLTITVDDDSPTNLTDIRDAINNDVAVGALFQATATAGVFDGGGADDAVTGDLGDASGVVGVNATTSAQTITINTVTGAGNDFDIQIALAASASITDTNSGDGVLAQFVGNADTGYTVTIANDAATNLDALAAAIAANINEVATATYSGINTDVLDFSRDEDLITLTPISVAGSADAVVATETIAVTGSLAAGANGNIAISFVTGSVVGDTTALSGNAVDGYVITIDDSGPVTFSDIAARIATIAEVDSAVYGGGDSFDPLTGIASEGNTTLAGGRNIGQDVITITANESSAAFDGDIIFNTANSTIGGISVTVNNGDITISVDSSSQYDLQDIVDAINELDDYTAVLTAASPLSGTYDANNANDNAAPVAVALTGGQALSGGLTQDAVVQLTGSLGSEVFNLQAGTSIEELVSQVNLVQDATGVSAAIGADGTTLELTSTTYGTAAIVDVKVSEEVAGTFTAAIGSGARATGEDVVATVNGLAATGKGNQLSINTATLDLTTSVAAGFTGTIEFSITGGGALFQLGPDVVSNQQARLGISSVNTAALGGVSGKLYQLGTGGDASLTSGNLDTAAQIVEEAINQVTSLRGRLGAFQRTTLETNKQALNDTLVNLSEAESSIRDADFAQETAALTRAQILVQSGTTVLQIANSNPQNVLALLRG